MTPRTRRLLGAVIAAFALLFIGRWAVALVAERWWAATISPVAAGFITSWQLLGFALDAAAILLASTWFAAHALLVARTITSVQVASRVGNLHVREAVPTRLLLFGAVAAGVLLGLIAGAGAHAWREPVVLAWQGLRYGITDPLLGRDFGVYVAQLPVWDLGLRFVALLVVLGLGFCLALYAGIGAVRREGRTLVLHADAQRHLGGLIAALALVIAVAYVLAPLHLAAGSLRTIDAPTANLAVHASAVMTGIALAVAVLTIVWALRGRFGLLAGSWIALGIGAMGQRVILPAVAEHPELTSERIAAIRRSDEIAWGIRLPATAVRHDTIPPVTALWDAVLFADLVEHSGGTLEAATATAFANAGQLTPAWLVATPGYDDPTRLDIYAIADGVTTGAGEPVFLRSGDTARSARVQWRSIADPRARPGGRAWQWVRDGVDAGGPLRRLILAWARQAPGMLRDAAGHGVDWHVDPVERADAILPMYSWLPADLLVVNARPTWVVQGMLAIDRFPLASQGHWDGDRVDGVVPAVICTVDAASGETRFYLDPAADSLGHAWARAIGSLVAPVAALPPDVRSALPYPHAWFDAQLPVLEGAAWNAGLPSGLSGPVATAVPTWIDARTPATQIALTDPSRASISTVVTAYRRDGLPELQLAPVESDALPLDSRADLSRQWGRAPVVQHLRDSVTAAGDSALWRGMRWDGSRDPGTAWQPLFVVPPRGAPALLWLGTALGERVDGGRTVGEGWNAARHVERDTMPRGPDDATILASARAWLRRADSAFRRGDLTAFGRAFEALRGVLDRRAP